MSARGWVSDKVYNFLGPVNSSDVYSLSTGISVRESIFDFWFSLFTLKIDLKYRLLMRKLPWALFAFKKLKLPWINWIARSKLKLPWVNWNCREQIEIAVSKLKLPWANWNCCEQIEIAVSKTEIAVTLFGHRKFATRETNSKRRLLLPLESAVESLARRASRGSSLVTGQPMLLIHQAI